MITPCMLLTGTTPTQAVSAITSTLCMAGTVLPSPALFYFISIEWSDQHIYSWNIQIAAANEHVESGLVCRHLCTSCHHIPWLRRLWHASLIFILQVIKSLHSPGMYVLFTVDII